MQFKSWRTGLLLLVGGAVLAGLTLTRCRQTASTSMARLPEGGTLTLLSAHIGTNHTYLSPAWDRVFSILPASWLARAGFEARRVNYLAPVLFIRLRQTGAGPVLHFVLADRTGLETSTLLGRESISRNGDTFLYVTGSSFPRRGSAFRLRAYAGSIENPLTNLVAEFSIPCPVRTNAPAWKPEPLPAVAQDGDIAVTLRDLPIDMKPVNVGGKGRQVLRGTATAAFRVTDRGGARRGWLVRDLWVRDATGNSERISRGEFQPIEGVPGEITLRFGWPLWSGESAYRLEVEFDRTADAQFDPAELWTVNRIALPPVDGITEINARTNLQGCLLELIALVGDHATLPGREHDVFQLTTMEVDYPPLAETQAFRVARLVDDRGRAASSMTQVGNHSFGFKPQPGAGSVDVTLAIYRKPRAEFTVRPEFAPMRGPG